MLQLPAPLHKFKEHPAYSIEFKKHPAYRAKLFEIVILVPFHFTEISSTVKSICLAFVPVFNGLQQKSSLKVAVSCKSQAPGRM
jgi:hypothetical protein